MPRPRARSIFELGGQWIAIEPGARNLYRFWNDASTGRTRRESLGTSDLEAAKCKLAEIVVRGATKTADSLVSAVLLKYFTERTDKLPSKKQSRNAGKVFLKCWGPMTKIGALTSAKQKGFVEWCIKQGFSVAYAARNMNVLKAACNHARVLTPDPIICAESKMRDKWGVIGKASRATFIPNDAEMVAIARAEMPERLKRWLILISLTGCRPEAALDLAPAARRRDERLIDLNPAGRRQNKKFRPTVRETRVLRVFLDSWERKGLDEFGGRYCGYTTIEGVKTALQKLRADLNLPTLATRSFRHKTGSVIRKARAGEDQVSFQLGHKRKDLRTTAGYGEFDPDYLAAAARAIDVWALKLRRDAKTERTVKHALRVAA